MEDTHLKTSHRVQVFHCEAYASRAKRTSLPFASRPSDLALTAFSENRRVALVWAS